MEVEEKKREENKIEVCFTYDINGILLAEATDLDRGTRKQVVLTSDTIRMGREELQKRVAELAAIMEKLREAIGTQNDQKIANYVREAEEVFDFLEGKNRQE